MTLDLKIDGPEEEDRNGTFGQNLLGTETDRPDGVAKVTGSATYAAEERIEGLAHGVLVRAPGLGAVRLLNADAVRALPGVLDVIQDPRMVRNAAQGTANEAPVQGIERADYVGQPIALVVGETLPDARHGARSLKVEADGKTLPVDPTSVPTEDGGSGAEAGDLEHAMSEGRWNVDAVYTTAGHVSAAMEPHAATAQWDGDLLTLRGSLQMLKCNRNELADSLGIDPEKVRLLAPFVGGGFGSKLGISADCVAAAIAAERLGRAVRVVQERAQVFEVNTHRAETRQRIRLSADGEGKLLGLGHETLASNLPGEAFSEPVVQATHFAYPAAARKIAQEVARVHRPAAGSVRAPGEAVGVTAFEIAMDELAVAAGIDPVELRLRNIPDKDPESGLPFSSHRLAAALTDGAQRFGWSGRDPAPRARREGEWWIGTGMAAAFRVNMQMEAEARVTLGPDGVTVETDQTDIGTGTYAILGQIAGELLGQPADRVEVRLGDTAFPPGSGSGGSFGATSSGTAVWLAAMEIRRQLAKTLGCAEADLTLKDGEVIHANERHPVADLLTAGLMEGHGHVTPGDAAEKARQATFGAHFAEVGVSDVSGEVRVRRMLGSFAAGRILNPRTARSQCHGGMTWGIGMALTEHLEFDRRDGHMVNRDLAQYHLPVNADVPPLEVHLVPEADPWTGPLHAKGIGELGICGAGAAVINAIHHACGVRIRDLPATPDKVLARL